GAAWKVGRCGSSHVVALLAALLATAGCAPVAPRPTEAGRSPRTAAPPPPIQPGEPAAVVGVASVIDGDTIEIHGQRVRLYGIDAPEAGQTCNLEGRPWRCGQASANALAERIGRRTVTCDPRDRDRYGRLVAGCSVAGASIRAGSVRGGWGGVGRAPAAAIRRTSSPTRRWRARPSVASGAARSSCHGSGAPSGGPVARLRSQARLVRRRRCRSRIAADATSRETSTRRAT